MNRSIFVGIGAFIAAVACTTAQVNSADTVALDLTNAICAVAADSPVGQPFTDIICTVATAVEQGIGGLTSSDAGVSAFAQAPTLKTARIRLVNADVPAFLASHKARP
jgi:hypothetical protein